MSTYVERWLSTTIPSVRDEPDFTTLLAENVGLRILDPRLKSP